MAEEEQPPRQVGIQTNKGGDIRISQSEVIIAGGDIIHQPQYFNRGKIDWELLLHPVEKLRLESFKLGDSAAAHFPFVTTPVKMPYQRAMSALQDARDETHRKKRGILVIGESNAGKTRLALEVVLRTLSTWLLLRWRPDYTKDDFPSAHNLEDKYIVLFLDDLQEYIVETLPKNRREKEFPPSNSHEASLRSLIEILYQASPHIVIVATCRRENLEQVQAMCGWLLLQLAEIRVPTFSPDIRNTSTSKIIDAFKQQKKKIYIEDWDGTLGSLVLGLSTKRDQYLNFPQHTRAVLKAMLLLTTANILTESEKVRLVCAEIFGHQQLLENRHFWQETLRYLITVQFIEEELGRQDGDSILIVRKDSYFEKVVCDYSPSHHAQQLRKDLILLRDLLYRCKDDSGLYWLFHSFSRMGLQMESLDTLNLCLKLNNSSVEEGEGQIIVFPNPSAKKSRENNQRLLAQMVMALPSQSKNAEKAMLVSNIFKQYEEADRLFTIARRQIKNGDVEEALLTLTQALMLVPNQIEYLLDQALCQILLDRSEEALKTLEQILLIDPNIILAWYYKGLVLLTQGSQQEGNYAIQQVVDLTPYGLTNLCHQALCLFSLKQEEKALSISQDVVARYPQQALSWFTKGCLLSQLERHEEALFSYEQALQLEPQEGEYLEQKCLSLISLDRHLEALQTIEQALHLDGESGSTWYLKGSILAKLKRFDKALESFNQALQLGVANEVFWSDMGACLAEMQRYQESLQALEQALQLDPHQGPAWHNKGVAFFRLERYHESFQAFDEALKWDPERIQTWLMKGENARLLGHKEQALTAFNQVLQLDPSNAQGWTMKANILFELEQYSEALKAIEHATPLNSEDINVWKVSLNIFLFMEHYKEAVQVAEQALKREPENVELYVVKSECLTFLGHYEEALSSWTQALQIEPENGVIWRGKGLILGLLERHEESIEALSHSLEFFPEDAQIWMAKGTALLFLGHLEESLATLNQATKLDPDNLKAWHNRATCLIRLESYEEALYSLDQVLRLDPDDMTIQHQRDIIVHALSHAKSETDTKKLPPYLKFFSRFFKLFT